MSVHTMCIQPIAMNLNKGGEDAVAASYKMEKATICYIQNITQRIRQICNITTPAIPLPEVMRQLHIHQHVPQDYIFGDAEQARKDDATSASIVAPQIKENGDGKFIIAHMMGHLILHMGYLTSPEVWKQQPEQRFQRFSARVQEEQANAFAMELLMPQQLFQETVKANVQNGVIDMDAVAMAFQVNRSLAVRRSAELGLIAWP